MNFHIRFFEFLVLFPILHVPAKQYECIGIWIVRSADVMKEDGNVIVCQRRPRFMKFYFEICRSPN